MNRPRSASQASLLHLVITDVRCGMRAIVGRLALVLGIANILCFMLFALVATGRTDVQALGFADYLSACLGGVLTYVARDGESFKLPAGWLCLCAALAYSVLDYPTRDLKGIGSQVLVASGSRRRWWLAKCAWVVLMSGFAWSLVLFTCLAWSCLAGDGLGADPFTLTSEVPALLGFGGPYLNETDLSVMELLVTAPVVLAALCMAQLAIAMATAPIAGFASFIATMLLSAIYTNPALPGNYLMIARSASVAVDGVGRQTGIMLAVSLATIAALLGNLAYAHRDIRGKEADAS